MIIFVLSWIVASIFAIITHIFIDELWSRGNDYYAHKFAEIFLFIGSLDSGETDPITFKAIIEDSEKDTAMVKERLETMGRKVKCLERVSFILYGIAIICSFVVPFLI